jgi:anti-anti-sigma regulatory factor
MATRRQSKRAGARVKSESPGETGVPADAAATAADASALAAGVRDTAPVPASAAPTVTTLGGALSIRTAAKVAEDLRAALKSGAIRVDASAVEQVDSAGVQLLVAAIATAGARGAPFEWVAVSGALRDAAGHLGLSGALRLPAAG